LASPEESLTTTAVNALRPPPGPRTIVLPFGGSIARAAVPALCERVTVLLAGDDVDVVTCEVGALADPGAVAVDALARMQLTARRLGRSIRLRHARGELRDLLALAGLCDVLPLCAGLRLEPRGQIEEREQARLDEEVDPADPTR
jgi:anti-anti-sigma regulatory factor